jgi:ABC-type multidrug transport system fused ATPase/permease subunit
MRGFTLKSLRQQISFVLQETLLFQASVLRFEESAQEKEERAMVILRMLLKDELPS